MRKRRGSQAGEGAALGFQVYATIRNAAPLRGNQREGGSASNRNNLDQAMSVDIFNQTMYIEIEND